MVKSFIFTLVFSMTICVCLHSQIHTALNIGINTNQTCYIDHGNNNGVDGVKSCDEEKKPRHLVSLLSLPDFKNLGFDFSYMLNIDLVNIGRHLKLRAGSSIGYSYLNVDNVKYTNQATTFNSTHDFGLHYITNEIHLNIKALNWIYIEGGVHGRYLIYRQFPENGDFLKDNEWENKYPIPSFYYDVYFGIGIEIKGINLKLKI